MKERNLLSVLPFGSEVDDNLLPLSLFAGMFDDFSEAVIVANTERQIVYINSMMESLFGYSKKELIGQQTKIIYAHESDFSEQGKKRFYTQSKMTNDSHRITYKRADGEHFLALNNSTLIRSSEGKTLGYIAFIRSARSSEQSLETLQRVHNITSDILLEHDEKVSALLQVGLEHFGFDIAILSRIIGDKYIVENCIDVNGELKASTEFELSNTYCSHALTANKTVGFHFTKESEIRHHPCYQHFKLESYIGTPLMVGGELYGTLNFSSHSATEPFCKDDYILMSLLSDTLSYLIYKKKSVEDIMRLAKTDELTGLLNRRATLTGLNEQIKLCQRSHNDLAILSIDIDYFKKINDKWGHAAGDAALIGFANVVLKQGREIDTCGRIGGEEFIFILPCTNLEGGLKFAEKLQKVLKQHPIIFENEESTVLNVSIGLATYTNGETIEQFLARADEAMYRAKKTGRDKVCQ